MTEFKLQSRQKLILIGDSITDCGRRDRSPPLGDGYVFMVANLATARYPDRKIDWLNKGMSGDTVQGLVERWTKDIIEERPDWVSIAIGINNVAREQAANKDLNDCLDDFERSYRQILVRTQEEISADIIMFEIFYVAEDDGSHRRLGIDAYNEVIHELAVEHEAILVPIHSSFMRAVSKRQGCPWTTGDGVHPLPAGHTLTALTFLEALGW